MDKVSILIILLLPLFHMPVEGFGQSPCPQYFKYVMNSLTNEMIGQIKIPFPSKNTELHLRVSLSIAVALPTRYVGRLELAQSKENSVRTIQSGRPLYYNIYFPLRQPIPLLTGIWFNKELYCVGPHAMGQIVTSIVLEHTLYPPHAVSLSQNFQPNPLPLQTPDDYHRDFSLPEIPTTKATIETSDLSDRIGTDVFPDFDQNNDCGRTTHINQIDLLISKGVKTLPGHWPWLVALFVVKVDFEFQCVGSVLTNRHVITAAHCFKIDTQTNVNIPPNAILVSLGRYRLREWRETGSVNREIVNYTLHPEYTHRGTADSDLAILVLRVPVEFTPTIKPICLWSGPSSGLQSVIDKFGYVVGWGEDEFGNSDLMEPRMSKMPIVSQEECLWSDPRFVSFTSNRTFCAGLRDGSGPCNGDSGSGFVLYDATTDRYRLRGIVSRSLFDNNKMSCDLSQYVVFVDVAKYMHWVKEQIAIT